jgi:hypothetical protein
MNDSTIVVDRWRCRVERRGRVRRIDDDYEHRFAEYEHEHVPERV